MLYRDGECCDGGDPSDPSFARDVPNWWHFSGARSLQAPRWCWKGHCDLMSRYSEAWSQGAGFHLYHLRSPMHSYFPVPWVSQPRVSACVSVCSQSLCPLRATLGCLLWPRLVRVPAAAVASGRRCSGDAPEGGQRDMWEPSGSGSQPSESHWGLAGAGSSSGVQLGAGHVAPLPGTAHPGHPPQTTSGTTLFTHLLSPNPCVMEPLGPW